MDGDDPDYEGRDFALQTHEETKALWLSTARKARDADFKANPRPMSVDDVRALVGAPPACMDPRVMGSVFSDGWKSVGFVMARGHCHARLIRLFLPAWAA
jgi:hypothetical protein